MIEDYDVDEIPEDMIPEAMVRGATRQQQRKRERAMVKNYAKMIMAKLDTDHSGTISMKECTAEKRIKKHCKRIMKKVDKNHDGKISRKELQHTLMEVCQQHKHC